MTEIDPLVRALIALCDAEGGYKYVADKAKVSPDNLWQIVSGIKLPSGNPRGVGPTLRAKLTAAYPDWQASKSAPVVASHIKPCAPEVPADLMLLVRWINGITDAKLRDLVIQECTDVFLRETRRASSPPNPEEIPAQTAKKQPA